VLYAGSTKNSNRAKRGGIIRSGDRIKSRTKSQGQLNKIGESTEDKAWRQTDSGTSLEWRSPLNGKTALP